MSKVTPPLRVAIAGLGTVGSAVLHRLQEDPEIEGRAIEIVAIGAKHLNRTDPPRGFNHKGEFIEISLPETAKRYDSVVDMANDPNIDVIIEAIGGSEGVAYDLAKSALSNGKHYITANKALVATHGGELSILAQKCIAPNKPAFAFEAAVGGGIPIINPLRKNPETNNIIEISAVLNGTCNFILSQMEKGHSYDDALREAQNRGYAETPPDFDVEGTDTAQKLSILSALAFGGPPQKIDAAEGIVNITPEDISLAKRLNCRIKLVAKAKLVDGHILQAVGPLFVPKDSALAKTDGIENVIVLTPPISIAPHKGFGAGGWYTAQLVLSDIKNIVLKNEQSLPFLSVSRGANMISSAPKPQEQYHIHIDGHIDDILRDRLLSLFEESGVYITRHRLASQDCRDGKRESAEDFIVQPSIKSNLDSVIRQVAAEMPQLNISPPRSVPQFQEKPYILPLGVKDRALKLAKEYLNQTYHLNPQDLGYIMQDVQLNFEELLRGASLPESDCPLTSEASGKIREYLSEQRYTANFVDPPQLRRRSTPFTGEFSKEAFSR